MTTDPTSRPWPGGPGLRLAVLLLCGSVPGCTVLGYPAMGPAPTDPDAVSGAVAEADGDERSPAPGSDGPLADGGPYVPEPLSESGNPDSYEVDGRRYRVMTSADGHVETGLASWYGTAFDGRRTSSGEIFDSRLLTAAHRTLPLPSWVEVRNLDNGRSVVVRVNDRGPFADPDERILDVSEAAARELGMVGAGVAPVRIRVLAAPSSGAAPNPRR